MTIQAILFWFFSVGMILSGVLVICSRNPINSAMNLIVLFVFMAGLFLLLEAVFLAVIQVLVYAGAVMVLFLFVLMLLNLQAAEKRRIPKGALVGGLLVAGIFIWECTRILGAQIIPVGEPAPAPALADLVKPVFVEYMLPFQVTAILLLVAMIGVVLLSRREEKP